MENDRSAYIPFSTYSGLYNEGDKVGFLAIVGKPNADVSVIESKVKDELKKSITFLRKIPMLSGALIAKEFKKLTGFLTGMQLLTIIVGTLTILAGVIAISNIL
jgi:putative ABC transport system permease protein